MGNSLAHCMPKKNRSTIIKRHRSDLDINKNTKPQSKLTEDQVRIEKFRRKCKALEEIKGENHIMKATSTSKLIFSLFVPRFMSELFSSILVQCLLLSL